MDMYIDATWKTEELFHPQLVEIIYTAVKFLIQILIKLKFVDYYKSNRYTQ